jgi:RimJ/RimL family protein N-acetyltransferase
MLILRPATPDDAMVLLQWQQHPDTRRHARTPAVPTETEHLAWFRQKLADPDCVFLLAESNSERVGTIRLDRRGDEWEVSIVVSPHARGRGLGRSMLTALDEITSGYKFVAEVHSDNQASHALFRAAGYRFGADHLYRKP